MNALALVREACAIVGVPQPNSIIGSSDAGVRQLLGLLNKEGRELSTRGSWEVLYREATFNTSAAEDQGAVTTLIGATNSYRFIVNETMWNRTRGEPVLGPDSPLDWQLRKTLSLSGPYTEYRIRGGRLLFLPSPSAGESIYFEYVSKNWCTDSTGSAQRRAISNDEDEVLLDDEIMLAGVEWRWRKAKGTEYAEEFNAYEALVANALARNGTKRRVSLASSSASRERRVVAPPGSWPL
jgi:hypothetical protein